MKNRLTNPGIVIAYSSVVFVMAAGVFRAIYNRSDLFLHVDMALDSEGSANFLYYWLVRQISLESNQFAPYVAVILLSFMVCLKFVISYFYLRFFSGNYCRKRDSALLLLSASLLILAPYFLFNLLFTGKAYLGTFTPNIWHNSTTIAVTPFAIFLFWLTCLFWESSQTSKRQMAFIVFGMMGLVLVNLIIKPSFLFSYIPAVLLLAVFSQSLRNIVVSGGGVIVCDGRYLHVAHSYLRGGRRECSHRKSFFGNFSLVWHRRFSYCALGSSCFRA